MVKTVKPERVKPSEKYLISKGKIFPSFSSAVKMFCQKLNITYSYYKCLFHRKYSNKFVFLLKSYLLMEEAINSYMRHAYRRYIINSMKEFVAGKDLGNRSSKLRKYNNYFIYNIYNFLFENRDFKPETVSGIIHNWNICSTYIYSTQIWDVE